MLLFLLLLFVFTFFASLTCSYSAWASSSSCSVSMLLLSRLGSSHIWPSAWQVIRGIILIARINPWMNGQPDSTSPHEFLDFLSFLPFPFLFSLSQGKVYYLFIYRRVLGQGQGQGHGKAASKGGSLHVSVWTWESSIFTFMHAHTHTHRWGETHTHKNTPTCTSLDEADTSLQQGCQMRAQLKMKPPG